MVVVLLAKAGARASLAGGMSQWHGCAMTSAKPPKTDLTGAWAGVYNYPGHPQAEHFDAVLYDSGGILTGTTHEHARLMSPARELTATIGGRHAVGEVAFVKVYDQPAGSGLLPISYGGHTNEDSSEISGSWTILGMRGTFLMIRQRPRAEELAEQRLAEMTAPRR